MSREISVLTTLWDQIEFNEIEMDNTTQDLLITLRDSTICLREAAEEIRNLFCYLDMLEEQYQQFKSALQCEVNTLEDAIINGNGNYVSVDTQRTSGTNGAPGTGMG